MSFRFLQSKNQYLNMKKIQLLVLVILFNTISAFSQTDQGNILVGGSTNLGFNFGTFKTETNGSQTQGTQKITNFNISPSVGYFLIDHLVVGISLPFSSSTNKLNNSKSTDNSIVISPFTRYYFTESNIKPFLQAQVGFGSNKNKFESDFSNFESTSNLFNYGILGGVAIFINDYIALDLGINYINSITKFKNDDATKNISSQFGFNAGISIIL